jgi:hypothetical protein
MTPIAERTTEQLKRNLEFAAKLMAACAKAGKDPALPPRLEKERLACEAELERRAQGDRGEVV